MQAPQQRPTASTITTNVSIDAAGGAASAAAAPDTDQHSEEASDDINNAPPPAPDGEGGISEDGGGTGGGGGNGEWDDGFPPEGRYRFYILSQDEAAAEASTAVAATDAGRTASSPGGDGSGQLKGRYHFVIIGEGTAADAAVESILRVQPEAEILCLSDETVKIISPTTGVLALLKGTLKWKLFVLFLTRKNTYVFPPEN